MKILTALPVVIALAACTGRDAKRTDSTLARDLALANQAQPAQPRFQDTSMSDAAAQRPTARIANPPRTRTIARAASASAPRQAGSVASREIAPGANISLISQQRICTQSNRPGDRIVATVISPVVGSNGAVVPSGASVILEVVSLSTRPSAENSSVALRVVSVEFNGMSYRVSGDALTESRLERTRIASDPNGDKKKVIGGAIAGAIIGQMIGKNTKGTVIGAATGAATGAVVAKAGEKYEACLPSGGPIRVTLNQALVLQ